MTKVVGIRFRNAGKIYYFDPGDFEMEVGSHAIVETARGVEFGTVLIAPREVGDDEVVQPIKPVIRVATEEDQKVVERNKEKEKSAYKICQEKIEKHGLEMKLVQAEYTFDNNKLLFYFTADGRIDFRELVKDLASVFRTRIELRQIGVRDETKILGGIGICGRELCCASYLSDFVPVSIKMAKEQNLSLNPSKISGVCGRLMCCLKNEEETYEYLNSRLPSTGDFVTTGDGLKGEVQSVSVLRQKVKVLVEVDDEKELREYAVDELKFKPRRKNTKLSAKELAQLEELEVLEEDELSAVEDDAQVKPEHKERETYREGREKRDGQKRETREQGERDRSRDYTKGRGRRDYAKDKEQGGERENREPRQRRNNNYYKNRNKRPQKGSDETARGERTYESRERKPGETR